MRAFLMECAGSKKPFDKRREETATTQFLKWARVCIFTKKDYHRIKTSIIIIIFHFHFIHSLSVDVRVDKCVCVDDSFSVIILITF